MKKVSTQPTWINVMERLVSEEVERQLGLVTAKKLAFLKPEQVITYALNRLSPLYANSAKGYEFQEHKARHELAKDIQVAVRQGIAAVERDPLRHAVPLDIQVDDKAQRALRAMRRILQQPELDWDNLPDVLETVLEDASQGKRSWQSRSQDRPAGQFDLRTGRIRSSW